MRWPFTVIFLLFSFSNAYAEYKAGVTVDTSSNMLIQPEGKSGTFVQLDGSFGRSVLEKVYVSYDTKYAFLQHYNGLQFQNHELSADYSLISGEIFTWSTTASGTFARFGNVTVLDGYNSYGFISTMKYYFRPTMPFRWAISLDNKDFLKYDADNYNEVETYLRLDKYFKTRTTLRLQLDSGARIYSNVKNDPISKIFDVGILIAQSFTNITGGNIEFHISSLSTEFSSSDSSRIYNRIFLDDRYKYSRKGISLFMTRVIPGKGSMKVGGTFTDRKYNKSALTVFDYLPQKGWTEKEKGVSLTLLYNIGFIPDFIHPSYRLYYIDADASESFLSYNAAGISVNFSIY